MIVVLMGASARRITNLRLGSGRGGIVDWVGQLQALQRDGFRYGLSLETHWRGAGTPEASTRIGMEGLKKTLTKAGISC